MDDGEENDIDDSRTVTIVLDLPPSGDQKCDGDQLHQQQPLVTSDEQNSKVAAFLAISSPPSSSDLLRPWRHHNAIECGGAGNDNRTGVVPRARRRVQHLRADMAQLLQQRLNPPGCGSMRNWEFVAAHLGLDIDQIVQMRRTKNPMAALMRQFGDVPLLQLLELIGEAERIDVLISVCQFAEKPFMNDVGDVCRPHQPTTIHLLPADNSVPTTSNTGAAPISNNSTDTFSSTFLLTCRSMAMGGQHPPRQRFILILHHENAGNVDLRKFHKLLLKNLTVYAKEEGIKIVDVDQCMSEQDLLGSVSRHIERADQVILELSPDYAELINAQQQEYQWGQTDQRVRMKLYLHQMTYNEVLFNGNQNRRFRVVLMQGCRPEHIPRGWPSNTLHYRFPQDFEELCRRLFEQKQQTTTDP